EGLSFETIGDRLGLSRKTIRGVWARGLKSVRRVMEGPPGGPMRYQDHGTSQ
ncbi:MAG: RNA polymerase subunit sigma-70, partial [Planctomycetota bacterium]|nr:RNA polymerase subunit sigma-70 [Planctomycetota bacterium]